MANYKLLPIFVVTTLLVACGGGSDAPALAGAPIAAGPADQYVGTWSNCQPVTGATNGVVSARTDFVFVKTAPAVLSVTVNGAGFAAANCAGNAINVLNGLATATVTLNGTKSIGTDTVDRLDIVGVSQSIPMLNGTVKELGFVSGNTLKFSAGTATDPQGYPTALDNLTVFTRL
jgi:hypothetical protein